MNNQDKETFLTKVEVGFLKMADHHLELSNLFKQLYQVSQGPNNIESLTKTLIVQGEISKALAKRPIEIMELEILEEFIND